MSGLNGQRPPSTRERQATIDASQPAPAFAEPAFAWVYPDADAFVRGHTKSDIRATYVGKSQAYIVACEAAIAKREADPERAARIVARRAVATA